MNVSVTSSPVAQPDDSRVIDALEAYVEALETGPRPNRAAFLARYPDIAEALAGCLDGLDFVHGTGHQLAPPLGRDRSVRAAAEAHVDPRRALLLHFFRHGAEVLATPGPQGTGEVSTQ